MIDEALFYIDEALNNATGSGVITWVHL
jgi:hypothetical protein